MEMMNTGKSYTVSKHYTGLLTFFPINTLSRCFPYIIEWKTMLSLMKTWRERIRRQHLTEPTRRKDPF